MKKKWIKFGKKAIRLLLFQPSAFLTRVRSNLLTPILPTKTCEIRVKGIRFQIDPKLDPVMKQMCYGFYEPEVTTLLKKYIRPGDVCIDVGANIGYLSAFMLGLAGRTGAVHSFEPVPQFFERLKMVQAENPEYSLHINSAALGDTEGSSKICVTNIANIGWNTMVPGHMNEKTIKEVLDIPLMRLDKYLSAQKLDSVRLIKIDTEGYEFPVLRGLEAFLEQTQAKPILIVEIAPPVYTKMGTTLAELAKYTQRFGYTPYSIETGRKLDLRVLQTTTDVLFLHPSNA